MQNIVSTLDELKRLAASRAKRTKTYRVTPEVARANYEEMLSRGAGKLRPMTSEQLEELAAFIDVRVDELRIMDPQIEFKPCPTCGRALTFTDLIHEAVESGHHDKKMMADVLLGRIGPVVTITGTEDDSHRFRCLACGDRSVLVEHGDCYKSGCGHKVLGYAHCAW